MHNQSTEMVLKIDSRDSLGSFGAGGILYKTVTDRVQMEPNVSITPQYTLSYTLCTLVHTRYMVLFTTWDNNTFQTYRRRRPPVKL